MTHSAITYNFVKCPSILLPCALMIRHPWFCLSVHYDSAANPQSLRLCNDCARS